MAGLGDHAYVGQVVEGSIDRGARDTWKTRSNGFEDLVGGWVIVELENRLQDDATLDGATLTSFVTQRREELDSLCSFRLVQAAAPAFSPPVLMTLIENMLHETIFVNKFEPDLKIVAVAGIAER
jgi:hypothetical protein